MADTQFLSPYAFGDLDEITAYTKRNTTGTLEVEIPRLVDAANAAVAWMESEGEGSGRRLSARTYRDAAAIASCGVTLDSTAVTGSGFTAGAKALDDVLGTSLSPGTRVASVTSDSALVLTKPATGTATISLTFGSEALYVDGRGGHQITLPEFPAIEVYSVGWVDDTDGTVTALDLTGARFIDQQGDRREYLIPAEAVPEGEGNIKVQYAAGYRRPSATSRGDWSDWNGLKRIFMRATLVLFQDWNRNAGRIVSENLAQQGINIGGWSMPKDLRDAIETYRRRW